MTTNDPLFVKKEINNFQQIAQPAAKKSSDFLNPEYSFSTFVVGRNNEFAHATSYRIAQRPGSEGYNPLFICGPTGMGKNPFAFMPLETIFAKAYPSSKFLMFRPSDFSMNVFPVFDVERWINFA